MISPRLFDTLPKEERRYWHTHEYEVKSGMLVMPTPAGIPSAIWDRAEMSEMHDIVPLYGKAYHFWQVDRGDAVPLGPPQLMTSFVSDESVKHTHAEGINGLLKDRDERFGISFEEKRKERVEVKSADKHPGLSHRSSFFFFFFFFCSNKLADIKCYLDTDAAWKGRIGMNDA